jgi:alpha-beta hydrolase superfamily lysophospholipase
MRTDTLTFTADDGVAIFVHRFLPEGAPIGIVHIAHGMAEHGARYARFAEALTGAGYAVYADDHRGHGRTAALRAGQGGDVSKELGFVASAGGWARLVADCAQLIAWEKKGHPGAPVIAFGHSMGSFIIQSYLLDHSRDVAAAVLSGSSGKPGALAQVGRLLARLERMRLGERGRSALLTSLSFDDFNKQFAPTRTGFDWLSRDPAEVDKYVADPACGFAVSTTLWVDVLDAAAANAIPARQAQVRKDLPLLLISGALDPVGEKGKGLERLVAEYRRAGLTRVVSKLYPDARHEILNETNRDEVTADLLAWLESTPEARAGRGSGPAT